MIIIKYIIRFYFITTNSLKFAECVTMLYHSELIKLSYTQAH